jgi:hypothetical protein
MVPFLYKVAQVFYTQYGNELYKHTFVFPNRRAGLFFQKYLASIATKPLFSPTVITIQELFSSLSSYQPADKIEMLVVLYDHFRKLSSSPESFDDFLYWGEMLLNDFDDVDKYMADAGQLFRNVYDFRSLDDDLTHLNKSQVDAIRRFWKNFLPVEGNVTKQKFQETWKVLHDLYTSFRGELRDKGVAYEGMMFREVAEQAKAKAERKWLTDSYVFVGLNALTTSEMILLDYLRDQGMADFYWDYESPFVHDKKNRASLRVNENLLRYPSKYSFNGLAEKSEKPKIELVGIPSGTGQAKLVAQILSNLVDSKEIPDPDEAINTAIVLPDENLLLPVLYSIPEEIGKINVTMGYNLSNASVASLVDHITLLQINLRVSNGETVFYHRFVKSILNHPLVMMAAPMEAETLKNHIITYNRIVTSESEIPSHPLLKQIFQPVTLWREIPGYLKSILSYLYNSLTEEKNSEENPSGDTRSIDLEREFIVKYYKSITRLQDKLEEVENMTAETFFSLLKKMSRSINVTFSGEPLSGLQVMGVLETRAIDFENLIILSMNEGVFPLKNPSNSFIPYTLRKGFGLPTYEHQDSTYAYHFYRMISRAKRVYMLYDTRTEEMQSGEVSRYFYQLKYLYREAFDIMERVATYEVSAPMIMPITVTKTAGIIKKLDAFRAGGESFLSATLVNNYIDCPLKFYFIAVEELSEESEVQESVESDVFGSIFHRLMEAVYNRYRGCTVTPDVLTEITRNDEYLTVILEKAFARYYFMDEENPRPLQGQHYLIGEILRSYVKQTLETDKQFTPFEYIGSEYRFNRPYRVNKELSVNFKGSIDRIDRKGERYRIIDYKTGTGETGFKDILQLFDASKNNRPHQILQVFLYGMFYNMENPDAILSLAVYYLRSVFKDFNPAVMCGNHPVEDISVYLPEFRNYFNSLLEEIFDVQVPFTQTKNEKNCQWCAFKRVCNR